MLKRLEPSIEVMAAMGADIVTAGPFRAFLSPTSDSIWANYAAPIESMSSDDDVGHALQELRQMFRTRRRVFRMEFNTLLWPRLTSQLELAGLRACGHEPLYLCTATMFRPLFNGRVQVRFLRASDDVAVIASFEHIVRACMLEHTLSLTAADVARLRDEIRRSGDRSAALARWEGTYVGTGYLSLYNGIGEITRVATLPASRRRGVAGTVTSYLTADAFSRGADPVWLTAASLPAMALYQKLGFRRLGDRVYVEDGDERTPS